MVARPRQVVRSRGSERGEGGSTRLTWKLDVRALGWGKLARLNVFWFYGHKTTKLIASRC